MSSFGEYVDGKTIAIVGPAPAPYDQTAEVDAHDIVYRPSYGFHTPADEAVRLSSHAEIGTDWYESGVFPAGYGTRVDMAFYNNGATRMGMRGELDQVLVDLDWAMFKSSGMPASGLTNVREVNRPPIINHGMRACPISGMVAPITNGPTKRPVSPPTIQTLIPRPSFLPETLPVITGPTACRQAELTPAMVSRMARAR